MSKYYLKVTENYATINKKTLKEDREVDITAVSFTLMLISTPVWYVTSEKIGSHLFMILFMPLFLVALVIVGYSMCPKVSYIWIRKSDNSKEIFSIVSKDVLKSQNDNNRISNSAMREVKKLLKDAKVKNKRIEDSKKKKPGKVTGEARRIKQNEERALIEKLI